MILGLDIGTNSVGWALIETDSDGDPSGVHAAGARCFDAGLDGDVGSGRGEPRNAKRRDARQARRQGWRRKRRRKKLIGVLQKHGLLPESIERTPKGIHEGLVTLDTSLKESNPPKNHREEQLLPYLLRTKSASEKVALFELGRSLYHLAHRRGFLSNRKESGEEDDETGAVKGGIKNLREDMESAGAKTLGGYFATLDPSEARIRQRWTARQMYIDEFNVIMDEQQVHHDFSDEMRKEIYRAIFDQRPLKSVAHLVGKCELEPTERRCLAALPIHQQFRLLCAVNNLLIEEDEYSQRALTPEERDTLIEALTAQGDLTFAKIRGKTVLGLPRGTFFNLEKGGEKRMCGDRTTSSMISIFGDRWKKMSDKDQERVINDLRSYEKTDALRKRGKDEWDLSGEALQAFLDVRLEQGYGNISRKALLKIVPNLEEGTPYSTARKNEYRKSFSADEPQKSIPTVESLFPNLRNPVVSRSLSEVRRVVNAICKEYGTPEVIRIELARDLKQSQKHRRDATKKMRDQESERKKAKERITTETGIENPSRNDILKVLLAEECGFICPYTGRSFDMRDIISSSPTMDIEHIIPFSRSLDNSFINKTLCDAHFNRNIKKNKTPWETSGKTDEWNKILNRVGKFKTQVRHLKLKKFEMQEVGEELIEEFASRQLNDTRYASKLAAKLVATLYGGTSDKDGTLRVQTCAGRATAYLRNGWEMNGILDDGPRKTRDDHRHHAVDAVCIALCDAKSVKLIAKAAEQLEERHHKLLGNIQAPWDQFVPSVREVIENIVVSHRVDCRLNGALHEETNYGVSTQDNGEKITRIRKPIEALSSGEVNRILDPRVKKAVLDALDGKPAKTVFKDRKDHPKLITKNGDEIPIHRVTVEPKIKNTVAVGSKGAPRHIAPGSNHHMAVVAVLNDKGEEIKWEGHIVTRLEAIQRKSRGDAVIQTEWTDTEKGQKREFKFSLRSGDTLSIGSGDYKGTWIVSGVAASLQIQLRMVNDARLQKDVKASGDYWQPRINSLKEMDATRLAILPLGLQRNWNA